MSDIGLNDIQSDYLKGLMADYQQQQLEASASYSKTEPNQQMGKDEFLELLIMQMKYQDPLNPMENTEFIAQTAQFTSLEQMTNLNSSFTEFAESQQTALDTFTSAINAFMTSSDMNGAYNYIGRNVKLDSNALAVSGGQSAMDVHIQNVTTDEAFIEIYDSDGYIVRRDSLGANAEGEYLTYSWDAQNNQGYAVSDGEYSVRVYSQDTNGNQTEFPVVVAGMVTSIKRDSEQGVMAKFGDNYEVPVSQIEEIY